ncbi:MAG: AI-2E family transporter [Bacteroidia bacterium]
MTDHKSLYTRIQNKYIVLILIVLIGVFLLIASQRIIAPLLSAAILYILFRPLFLYFSTKKKLNASLSAAIVISISFLVLVVPLSGLSFMIIHKIAAFQNPDSLQQIVEKIQQAAGPNINLKDMVTKSVNDISKWALGAVSVFVSNAVSVFISLIVLYFTLFFMFQSHKEFENALLKYLPFDKKDSLRFGTELKNMTYSNILGQGLIGLSQGIIVAIGFLIFGIPDAIFWGFISIFVCFLPVVGAPIIFVPAGIIELINGNTVAGVGILIWGAVLVTLVDNFLRQFISKKIADTHPLITIIGVIIGIPVFGLIGLVIGPFMISFFILLFKMYENNHLVEKEPLVHINQTHKKKDLEK